MIETCIKCDAPLAPVQRYCIKCGKRVDAFDTPFGVPAQPAVAASAVPGPSGSPQLASLYAAMALGFGIVIGTALEPNLAGIAASPPTVIQLPAEEPPAEPPASSGSGGGGGAGAPAPASDSFIPAPSFIPPSNPPSNPTQNPPTKPDEKQILTGVVVHTNPNAHSYAIATGGGPLSAIHAAQLPAPGTRVKVPVRPLRNETYAQLKGRKRTGEANQASFSGTVTFKGTIPGAGQNDPAVPVYAVSSRGVSVLVRVPVDPQAQPPETPGLGDLIDVEVDVVAQPSPTKAERAEARAKTDRSGAAGPAPAGSAAPCNTPAEPSPSPPIDPAAVLRQRGFTVTLEDLTNSELEGIVQSVCPGDGELVVSADDIRESGQDLIVQVPDSIQLSKVVVGQSVSASLERDQGKTEFTITGLASDQGASGADARNGGQGDLAR